LTHEKGPTEVMNFAVFQPLRNVLNVVYKCLHSKGIGVDTKATALQDQEDILWEKGVLVSITLQDCLMQHFSIMAKYFT